MSETFKLWTWGDPADELRRYGSVVVYRKRPRDALTSKRATLTLQSKKQKRKPKK